MSQIFQLLRELHQNSQQQRQRLGQAPVLKHVESEAMRLIQNAEQPAVMGEVQEAVVWQGQGLGEQDERTDVENLKTYPIEVFLGQIDISDPNYLLRSATAIRFRRRAFTSKGNISTCGLSKFSIENDASHVIWWLDTLITRNTPI